MNIKSLFMLLLTVSVFSGQVVAQTLYGSGFRGSESQLVFTNYGQDNRNRRFDILVDGEKVADENLGRFHGDRFYDIFYKIPKTLTLGRKQVRVTVKSIGGSEAGPVYGVRVIRGESTTGDERDEIQGR